MLARISRSLTDLALPGPPDGRAIGVLVAGAAAYGGAIGAWHGPTLALYCAIKLPLVLLATASLTLGFQWLSARLLGLPLPWRAAAGASVRALSVAAAILGGLTPIAALFVAAAPPPGVAARTAHNLLYLTHTTCLALAGSFGAIRVQRQLAAYAPRSGAARVAFVAWILSFALVAGEVAWILRPFVGSVFLPLEFLRADALEGNVYEFIWTDVVPQLERAWRSDFRGGN